MAACWYTEVISLNVATAVSIFLLVGGVFGQTDEAPILYGSSDPADWPESCCQANSNQSRSSQKEHFYADTIGTTRPEQQHVLVCSFVAFIDIFRPFHACEHTFTGNGLKWL